MSSGLLRYRSAPTTLLAEMCEDSLPPRPSSPDTATMFARFLHPPPERSSSHFAPPPQAAAAAEHVEAGFSAPQMLYHSAPSLVRHSSSPVGLFNGYGAMGGLSRQGSTGLMSPISEMGDAGGGVSAWGDSGMLSGGFSAVKRQRDVGDLNQTEIQFQQDSVLCKMRAKRGCATHPRSIAERVRRTRISERMRKLQELVPNMDKQTNTADMLDLAVEYIKDLQREAKTLSESRASCICSSKRRHYSSTAA